MIHRHWHSAISCHADSLVCLPVHHARAVGRFRSDASQYGYCFEDAAKCFGGSTRVNGSTAHHTGFLPLEDCSVRHYHGQRSLILDYCLPILCIGHLASESSAVILLAPLLEQSKLDSAMPEKAVALSCTIGHNIIEGA